MRETVHTLTEAAALLKMAKESVRMLLKSGHLPRRRQLPGSKKRGWNRADLIAGLNSIPKATGVTVAKPGGGGG